MRIDVGNMVCNHCVNALRTFLEDSGLHVVDAGLGYAVVEEDALSPERLEAIDAGLRGLGFERIVNQAQIVASRVKQVIIDHISTSEPCPRNMSDCIERAIGQDYKSISRLFAQAEGRTIEKYRIAVTIEKVKELLSYGNLPLSEIAYRLGYSSAAHLSAQFKKVTGLTPTQYAVEAMPRRPLSDV